MTPGKGIELRSKYNDYIIFVVVQYGPIRRTTSSSQAILLLFMVQQYNRHIMFL